MNKASFSRLAFTVIIVALAVILLLWGYFMGPEYLRHQPWHALLLRPPGLIVFAIGALTLLRGKTRQVLLFIFALLITIPFLLHRINGAPYLIFAIPTGLLALVVFIALTRRRDWCAWAFWLYLLITIALLPIIYFFAAMGHAFESSSPLPQQTVFRLGAVLLLPGIVIYALKWNYFRNGAGKAVAAPPLPAAPVETAPAAPVETAPANTEIKSERSYLVVGLGLSMIPITQLILPFSWRYPWLAAITGVAVACLALAALLKPAQITNPWFFWWCYAILAVFFWSGGRRLVEAGSGMRIFSIILALILVTPPIICRWRKSRTKQTPHDADASGA